MVLTVRRGDTHDVDAGPDTNGTTTRQRRSVQMCNVHGMETLQQNGVVYCIKCRR